MRKSRASSVPVGRVAKNGGRTPHQNIDFSDIPELGDGQLAHMRRVGRPPVGDRPKTPISIRLDRKVLEWVKRQAAKLDRPYQTLISDILEREMKKAG